MSNLTDFFPSGGGGLTPKFQEFNASGTFTPSQALIDAGGYIELFLVGGGGRASDYQRGGSGGETILKKMYLTSTTSINVTIAASSTSNGNSSSFTGSAAVGSDVTSLGGASNGSQNNMLGAGFSSLTNGTVQGGIAGSGVFGYGTGGGLATPFFGGVLNAKANSGQGAADGGAGGSGYCLIKWYE